MTKNNSMIMVDLMNMMKTICNESGCGGCPMMWSRFCDSSRIIAHHPRDWEIHHPYENEGGNNVHKN